VSPREIYFDGVALDAADRGRGPYVWRFTVAERVLHALLLLSFYVLAFTGLPLRFSCVAWAPALMKLWGGAPAAGAIHRWAAGFLLAALAGYGVYAVVAVVRSTDRKALFVGPESILLQPSDFRQFWQKLRWAVGRGEKPRHGRYSYRERFSYLITFLGLAVIAASGVLLWFPERFAHVLPGWVFNAATVVHSYNVMLLAALIVTYHFVDVHLLPNKFPLDGVMFTGRATYGYMQEEHPLVAEAIGEPLAALPSAVPERDRVAPEPPRWLRLASSAVGMLLLALGALLVGLSLWDALC
jgi:cytochrome b subunit of formate dehydrogenase